MRPSTTSSSPSEQSVSLSAMSLTALPSKDMLDGREPTSIILPFEAVPDFPLFFFKCSAECFSFLFLLYRLSSFSWSGSKFLPCRDAATAVSFGLLICFNPCTCQGCSASYSNIHELGRYWITYTAPPFFSKKSKRQRREGQSHNQGGRERGKEAALTATTSPPTVCPRGIPE